MPNINAHQISLIHYAHARGFSAHRIAALSGVTPAATERYLLKHRLNTGCRTTRREKLAVKILSHLALARSIPLGLRTCRNNSNGYDYTLIVGGKTVYTTVAHQQSDGSYRFNLSGAQFASANSRLLTKRCRVVVLVGLPKSGGNPEVYMLDISLAAAKILSSPSTIPQPYRLFVDDERDPAFLAFLATHGVHDLVQDGPWVIARTQSEAQQIINERGLPELISFDHDYGPPEAGNGHDLAKWLVEQALDGLIDLRPLKYQVHSRNPVGQVNIRGVLDSYLNSLG